MRTYCRSSLFMYLTELYLVSPSEAYSTKEHLSPPRFVSCCRFRGLPSAVPKTCFHISFSRPFPDVFDRPVPIVLSIAAVHLNRQSRAIGRKGRRRQTEREEASTISFYRNCRMVAKTWSNDLSVFRTVK